MWDPPSWETCELAVEYCDGREGSPDDWESFFLAQHRYNGLSMLHALQTFTDEVVPRKQGSKTNPVRLAGTVMDAGAVTSHLYVFWSPVGIPSVWEGAGSHTL